MSTRTIIEQATLNVIPRREPEFELAFAKAKPLVEGMPGCLGASISRGVERPSDYLLLIEWESIEAHEVGFRGSSEYQEWKRLLHHFYEPFPNVFHYQRIDQQPHDPNND